MLSLFNQPVRLFLLSFSSIHEPVLMELSFVGRKPTRRQANVSDISGCGQRGDNHAVLRQVLSRGHQEHLLLAGPQAVGENDLRDGVDPAVAVVDPQWASLAVTLLHVGVQEVLDVQVCSTAAGQEKIAKTHFFF